MATPVHDGTPPTTFPPSGVQQQEDPGGQDSLLTGHAALVFLAAVLIGLVAGVLGYLSTGNTAGALLGGLTAAGVSVAVLHRLIGP